MKLFANYGRFFAKIPNDLAARALSADAGVSRADYFDANLTQPIPEGVSAGETTRHLILAGLSPSTFDTECEVDLQRRNRDRRGVGSRARAVAGGAVYASQLRPRARGRRHRADDRVFPAAVVGAVERRVLHHQPWERTPVSFGTEFGDAPITFEDAVHDYNAVEFEADKRFSNNWSLQASYRYSRTTGNFEGFFRNDNGQSDPGITSLFDFPTNDPTYATLGREEGFRGDIRYLGTAGIGPLPNDRRHQGKVYGNYLFGFGVNLGVGLNLARAVRSPHWRRTRCTTARVRFPRRRAARDSRPNRASRRGRRSRATIDVHADYNFRLFGARHLTLLADVFNLAGRQGVRDYDDFTETSFGAENPDFGRILVYQDPRTFRFGVRVQF